MKESKEINNKLIMIIERMNYKLKELKGSPNSKLKN